MFLLDTNVISELRQGKPHPSPQVRAWAAAQPCSHLYLSAIGLLELAAQVPQNAFWLVSPAVRSYSTAHVLRRLAGLPVAGIQLDDRLYESRGDKLMSLLQAVGEDVQHLVLVAHSPGLDELASSLCASAPTSLTTGSMLLVTLQIERWADCQAGCGELVMHLAPTE